jgi:hypothetical protein
MPVTPAIWEAEIRGSRSEASWGKNTRPYLKNKLKGKRTRAMAQVVEYKALRSSLSTTKNLKKIKILLPRN